MGRLLALQKPTGGVRGIVTGEVFRRFVARNIDEQLACAVEVATSPFQYAFATEGGECVAHAVETCHRWHWRVPPHFPWGNAGWRMMMMMVPSIHQGEGGEQGDPLMPMLFALGQHQALRSLQHFLRSDERFFAYLDDIYVVCAPERVGVIHARLKVDLWEFARIQVHMGKTQVWNRGGHYPPGCTQDRTSTSIGPSRVHWEEGRGGPL